MTKVAVAGYFGWGNFGDQLFFDTVNRRRDALWPESTTVASLTSKHLAFHARAGALGSILRALHALKMSHSADVLAYCGGSVFGDVSGIDALRRRIRPDRVEALGVSLGPFASSHDRAAVLEYIAGFDRLVIRDRSWRLLEMRPSISARLETGLTATLPSGTIVEYGGDLAALSPLINQVPAYSRDGLVVCPSAASGGNVDDLARQVLQATRELRTRGSSERVRIIGLNGHPKMGDASLVRKLESALRQQGIKCETEMFPDLGLGGTIAALSSAELVLSQRLHGAIVAYLSGGPFIMIDHHPKCRAFVEDVTGSDSVCLPLAAAEITDALDAALNALGPDAMDPVHYISRAHRVYFR